MRVTLKSCLVLAFAISLCACGDEPEPSLPADQTDAGGAPMDASIENADASIEPGADAGTEIDAGQPPVVEPDWDGDGISDEDEALLGTDPYEADTDGDGLTDHYELTTTSGGELLLTALANADQDELHAALDRDDNADGVHDGSEDVDRDGISNALEYYGFSVVGLNRQIVPWGTTYDDQTNEYTRKDPSQLDYGVKYYKTNPTQPSSDGDPYGDKLEATGVGLDQGVVPPANNPSVPALPVFYVVMNGMQVTPVGQLAETIGSSNSWSNTTSQSTTTTATKGFDCLSGSWVGDAVNWGLSQMLSDATTEQSVSQSTSGVSDWSKVTTTQLDQAAKLKVNIKVFNYGTAPAADVVPTLSLALGNRQVVTFKTPSIGTFGVKDEKPAGSGNYYVIDKAVDASGNVSDIFLSLDELRSFQSGAPFHLSVAEVQGKVQKQTYDPQSDTMSYEVVGDWSDYTARLRAISTSVVLDVGDGRYATHLVSTATLGPKVTLLDALLATAGVYEDQDDGNGQYHLQGLEVARPDGSSVLEVFDFAGSGGSFAELLKGWTVTFDQHYSARELRAPASVWGVALKPGSVVYLKAPPAAAQDAPPIPWATMSPSYAQASPDDATFDRVTFPKLVQAFVTDYFGVDQVWLEDGQGRLLCQLTDEDGDSIYSGALPASFWPSMDERVVASNVRGIQSVKPLSFVDGMTAHGPELVYRFDGTVLTVDDSYQCFGEVSPKPRIDLDTGVILWSEPGPRVPAGTDLFALGRYASSNRRLLGFTIRLEATPPPTWQYIDTTGVPDESIGLGLLQQQSRWKRNLPGSNVGNFPIPLGASVPGLTWGIRTDQGKFAKCRLDVLPATGPTPPARLCHSEYYGTDAAYRCTVMLK